MSAPVAVAAVTSAAAIAAGCGAATDEGTSDRSAAAKTAPTSARLVTHGELDTAQADASGVPPIGYTGEGSYDWERDIGRLETRFRDDDYRLEIVALADAVYTSLPPEQFEGKRWLESRETTFFSGGPLSWVGGGFVELPESPADVLPYLRKEAEAIELVGSEDIRGTTTTHYRAELPVRGEFVERNETVEEPVAVGVWVDPDGLARRIRLVPPAFVTPLRVTLEFFDFGVPVEVSRPAADEILSADDFDDVAPRRCPEGEHIEPRPEDVAQAEGWTSYGALCLIDPTAREESDE
jgi:hypothetical protein